MDNLADHIGAAGRDEHRETLNEVERLGRILDGLLGLALAERGHQSCEVVDVAEVADQRVAAWQPLAERRGITLRRTGMARAAASTVVTGADQALDALIDNALKFAGAGATILVDVARSGPSVDVDVVDDGPGLSADERHRAAERFWRAPDASDADGSGLGLPIVAALAEASGGGLRLLPAYPRGLDAKLSFPAADSARGHRTEWTGRPVPPSRRSSP
jgi:signal transduction histidine kinase